MGMNKILSVILLLSSCVVIRAANPAYTDFRGTNQVLISSNVSTGRIIIGPATPISTTASNAAFATAVWTNKSGAITIVGSNQPVFQPGIASANDTTAYDFGTSNLLTATRAHLLGLRNQGTNQLTVGVDGRILVGPKTENEFGFDEGAVVEAFSDMVTGGTKSRRIKMFIRDLDGNDHGVELVTNTNNESWLRIQVYGVDRTMMNPNVNDGATAVPYIFDNSKTMSTDGSHLMDVANKGTNRFWIDRLGTAVSTNGFASYSLLATNAVGGTGYTNNQIINQVVYLNGTAVAVTQKNRSGTTIVPATTFTGTMTVVLQPGWAVTAASGLTGTACPF